MSKIKTISLIYLLLTAVSGYSQTYQKYSFDEYIKRAEKFGQVNLSGEELDFLNKALMVASNDEEYCVALYHKAELLRATRQFQQAIETLWKMKYYTKGNVEMQIKMYGRLAAVHQEGCFYESKINDDSVRFDINTALTLAKTEPEKFQLEIASLYNELGMFVYRRGDTPQARNLFQISCDIYSKNKNDRMLITPMSNLLELESCSLNHDVSNHLANKLLVLIENKEWYAQMLQAYKALEINASTQNDTLTELFYVNKYLQTKINYDGRNNSNKLLTLSEIYERNKLEKKVSEERLSKEEKIQELKEVSEFSESLIIVLSFTLSLILVTIILFVRERRIKARINSINTKLNFANEKYQLLVIESNHRIKNNLQMITAMLEYTGKSVDPSETLLLQSINQKINTISSLHKHLYVDVHNDLISVELYFTELLKLYKNMYPDGFNVDLVAENVYIRSERIVYFGLIFNEMLSNTVEHSFENIGKIKMHLTSSENGFNFFYSDHSVRCSHETTGTGISLIKSLIDRIGGFNYNFNPSNGGYQFEFTQEQRS